MATKKENKALTLLRTNKTVNERAEKYTERIRKSLSLKIIDSLKEKIEKIDDKIFDLENFSLETNLNKGMKQLTKEDCEARFEEIIDLSFNKKVLELELAAKQEAFDAYFG